MNMEEAWDVLSTLDVKVSVTDWNDFSKIDVKVERNAIPAMPCIIAKSVMHPKLVASLKQVMDFPSSFNCRRNVKMSQARRKKSEEEILHRRQPCNGDEALVVPLDVIKNKRPFKCDTPNCFKTFKNPQTLKMHRKTHSSYNPSVRLDGFSTGPCRSAKGKHNKKIPCKCPFCYRTFVGLYELRRHVGRKHSQGEKQHRCNKCAKGFYIEVDRRDHEKLCGVIAECPACGARFSYKCNLVTHRKEHPECVSRGDVGCAGKL